MTQRTRAYLVATASAAALLAPAVGVAGSPSAQAAEVVPPSCTYKLKHDVKLRKHRSVKSISPGTLKAGYGTQRSCSLPKGGWFEGCRGGNRWMWIAKRSAWAPVTGGCWKITEG